MSKYNKTNENDAEDIGAAMDGMRAGEFMQTRFTRIPDAHLNTETVAGIRDMNLGRMKNGKPAGAPTIRFDTGAKSGANPHINIDPKGRPNAKNPHVEVPSGVINSAQTINKVIKYAGIGLTVAAVVIDTYRIGKAFTDDIYIRDHANEIISELEDAIDKLKSALKESNSSKEREEIRMTIDHLENALKDVRRTKKVPVKFIKTTSAVAGGWTGGLGGGTAGAWAGAQAGAAVGLCLGPAGAAVAAPIGAVIGAIGGGISCGMAGGFLGKFAADKSLDALMD